MKKLLLIFSLIFGQALTAHQIAPLNMKIQQNDKHRKISKNIDKSLMKAPNNKPGVKTSKELNFRSLINAGLVKNLGEDFIEYSNTSTDNPNANGENLIIKNLISNGDIVFDVGANVGNWTNQVLSSHKDVHIFSFEPINSLVESMRKRFKDKNVKIYESAVFSEEKTIIFNYYEKWPQSSSIYPQNWLTTWLEDPKKICVNAISLDQFCANNQIDHIDFLKIDVEGSELDVLKGTSDLLRKRAIDFIQFAYHRAYFGAQISLKQIYDLLTSFKYSIFKAYTDGLIYISEWDDTLENYRRSNYIAIANFDSNSTLKSQK